MIMMIVIWRERASWRWSNTDIDTIYHRTSINRLSFSLPFLEKEKKKEINISDFTKPDQHKYKKWKLNKKGLYQHKCKHFFQNKSNPLPPNCIFFLCLLIFEQGKYIFLLHCDMMCCIDYIVMLVWWLVELWEGAFIIKQIAISSLWNECLVFLFVLG